MKDRVFIQRIRIGIIATIYPRDRCIAEKYFSHVKKKVMPCENARDPQDGRGKGIFDRHQLASGIGGLGHDLGIQILVGHYASGVTYSQKAFVRKQTCAYCGFFFIMLIFILN